MLNSLASRRVPPSPLHAAPLPAPARPALLSFAHLTHPYLKRNSAASDRAFCTRLRASPAAQAGRRAGGAGGKVAPRAAVLPRCCSPPPHTRTVQPSGQHAQARRDLVDGGDRGGVHQFVRHLALKEQSQRAGGGGGGGAGSVSATAVSHTAPGHAVPRLAPALHSSICSIVHKLTHLCRKDHAVRAAHRDGRQPPALGSLERVLCAGGQRGGARTGLGPCWPTPSRAPPPP